MTMKELKLYKYKFKFIWKGEELWGWFKGYDEADAKDRLERHFPESSKVKKVSRRLY